MAFSEAELDRRCPVWVALSDLFLDTELQTEDYERIAEAIVASGYSLEEAERILRREVAPIVGVNMLSVAGIWAGFDEAWLVEAILQRETTWRRFVPGFTAWRMVRGDWRAIQRLVAEKRPG